MTGASIRKRPRGVKKDTRQRPWALLDPARVPSFESTRRCGILEVFELRPLQATGATP